MTPVIVLLGELVIGANSGHDKGVHVGEVLLLYRFDHRETVLFIPVQVEEVAPENA